VGHEEDDESPPLHDHRESLLMRSFSPNTDDCGALDDALSAVLARSRLSSGDSKAPGRCIPCAAWFDLAVVANLP